MEREGPIALVDGEKASRNIHRLAQKTRAAGIRFRPHFKTHRSASIGEWFRNEGVSSITVPSLPMASYFLDNGWKEQTVAFPLTHRDIDEANELLRSGNITFSLSEGAPIERIDQGLELEASFMIELDTGDARTGLDPFKPERIDAMLKRMEESRKMKFRGFLTHSGHSYGANGVSEIKAVHEEALRCITTVKERYRSLDPIISVGDTPTASVMDRFDGVDELRPGNFVFYDLMQERIGSCKREDIAYCLSCPVVAKHPDRSELVVRGGAVHLSLDRLHMEDGNPCFGLPVRWQGEGWGSIYEGSWMKRLSQEHGVVQASDELFRDKGVGDRIGILPVHSCLSADAMNAYQLLNGEKLEKF